jgi:hypothetical protein
MCVCVSVICADLIFISVYMLNPYTGRFFSNLTSSRFSASRRPVRLLLRGAYEFCRFCSQLQSVGVIVRYASEQRVFLYDTSVKYASVGKCRRKFRYKFRDGVPSRKTIHNLENKLRTTGLSTRNKNISAQCLLRRY